MQTKEEMALEDILALYDNERTEIIFDGSNFYSAVRKLEMNVDYSRVRDFVTDVAGNRARLSYFTALPSGDVHSPIKPLVDFLSFNGFNVVTKEVSVHTDDNGRERYKGDVDVDIATHMMRRAFNRSVDHIILFSGDGDYVPVVEALKEFGVKVTAVSVNGMAADTLRRSVDNFVFMDEHLSLFKSEFEKRDD